MTSSDRVMADGFDRRIGYAAFLNRSSAPSGFLRLLLQGFGQSLVVVKHGEGTDRS